MPQIDVYTSLNSPWAYLGWARFRALAAKHDVVVTVKPARFGDVFEVTGGLPLPKRAPARRAYRLMEMTRWRDFHGRPIVLEPKNFPSDETAAARFVIAAQHQGHDAARLAEEIGKSLWELELNIAETVVLADAARRAGLDLAAIRAGAPADADLDAQWAANTADAIARGVFGAPSYVLDNGEIFWGQDRVELLGWRLARL